MGFFLLRNLRFNNDNPLFCTNRIWGKQTNKKKLPKLPWLPHLTSDKTWWVIAAWSQLYCENSWHVHAFCRVSILDEAWLNWQVETEKKQRTKGTHFLWLRSNNLKQLAYFFTFHVVPLRCISILQQKAHPACHVSCLKGLPPVESKPSLCVYVNKCACVWNKCDPSWWDWKQRHKGSSVGPGVENTGPLLMFRP